MAKSISQFEQLVKKALKVLPVRTQKIMEERYGLFGKRPTTLEAIGKREGITRERVRQIENDSLKRIRESKDFSLLDPAFAFLENVFKQRGWVISEHDIEQEKVFGAPKSSTLTFFLLELAGFAERRKENSHFHARWYHNRCRSEVTEKALKEFVSEIRGDKSVQPESEFLVEFSKFLKNFDVEEIGTDALRSYISITKHIKRNVWGEFGHVLSPLIKPRGMKDEAYIVLLKSKKPLHFSDIAERIGKANARTVHVQTVHNELIKDDRFVLVGRGIYALGFWGYEPGFVKDVIMNVLQGGPATEEEIVKAVCAKRFVKKSTVVTNLQNKKLFLLQENGTYMLLS